MPDHLAGKLSLFGTNPVSHRHYAEQIIAEEWTREFIAGRGWKEGFIAKTRNNHWLDCTANARAAIDILRLEAARKIGTRGSATVKQTPIRR